MTDIKSQLTNAHLQIKQAIECIQKAHYIAIDHGHSFAEIIMLKILGETVDLEINLSKAIKAAKKKKDAPR